MKNFFTLVLLGVTTFGFAQGTYVPGHYTRSGKYVAAHYTKGRSSVPSSKTSSRIKNSPKSGVFISSSTDDRFRTGDRVVSLKDSSGKSFSIKDSADFNQFVRSHKSDESVTVRLERDKKYHSYKVKNFASICHI